jgi:hypothetical protein
VQKGMYVAVVLDVTNADWYNLPFVIAQIKEDCTKINTADPSCNIEIQVFMPTGHIGPNTDLLTKKFVPWQGDDGKFWTLKVERSTIKAINLRLNTKMKTLTAGSLDVITKKTFMGS